MELIITGIISFIIIYLLYYFFIVKVQRKKKYRSLNADALLFKEYYKIDIKKIGYKKFYRILNFVNALMLTIMIIIVYNFNSYMVKIIVLVIIMLPSIWFVYYFLAKYYKYLEGKGDKNV